MVVISEGEPDIMMTIIIINSFSKVHFQFLNELLYTLNKQRGGCRQGAPWHPCMEIDITTLNVSLKTKQINSLYYYY